MRRIREVTAGMSVHNSIKVRMAVFVLLVSGSAASLAGDCGSPYDTGGIGPFDYTDKSNAIMLDVTERHHFFGRIKREAFGGGKGDINLTGDLDYTLRAFPNHSMALYAMGMHQLHVRRRSEAEYQALFGRGGMWRSAECYFERALMLRPDDADVHTKYGLYLYRKRDLAGALEKFTKAVSFNPDSAKAHYNLGLITFEMKRYDESREHAKKAYRLGFKKTDLKRLLKRKGKWE